MRHIVFLGVLLCTSACGVGDSDLRSDNGGNGGGGGGMNPTCALDLAHRGHVSTWRVDAGDTVRLPLPRGFNYNFAINWGDQSGEAKGYPFVSAYDDPDVEHTYGRAGEYQVTIYGQVEAWSFATFPQSKDKIIAVDELGDVGWKNLQGAFKGCRNLSTVRGGETQAVQDMSSMFAAATSLQLDVSDWSFKEVNNMQGMFSGVALPDTSYSNLLKRILQTTEQHSVPLDGGESRYDSSAAAAKARLESKGWQITDGGPR